VGSTGLAGLAALAGFATFAGLELARTVGERIGICVLCKFHFGKIYTDSSGFATRLICASRKRASAFRIISEHLWKNRGCDTNTWLPQEPPKITPCGALIQYFRFIMHPGRYTKRKALLWRQKNDHPSL
jgi:hypothetical protein